MVFFCYDLDDASKGVSEKPSTPKGSSSSGSAPPQQQQRSAGPHASRGAGGTRSGSTAGGSNNSSSSSGGGGLMPVCTVGEYAVKPFNKQFVRALDEFLDRLGQNGECFRAIKKYFVLVYLQNESFSTSLSLFLCGRFRRQSEGLEVWRRLHPRRYVGRRCWRRRQRQWCQHR
jgi:hypothetical protein